MLLLPTHIFLTLSSLLLGYYLFIISKIPLYKQKILSGSLSICLIISAITGILLNTYSFSPFHVLAIVTITTIPLAWFNFMKKNYTEFTKGIFFNVVGLNIAFVGALAPERYLGYKLWHPMQKSLDLSNSAVDNAFIALLSISFLYAVCLVMKAIKDSNFFRM
jgi:hypothetical protein